MEEILASNINRKCFPNIFNIYKGIKSCAIMENILFSSQVFKA